jgi:hypothetical protein
MLRMNNLVRNTMQRDTRSISQVFETKKQEQITALYGNKGRTEPRGAQYLKNVAYLYFYGRLVQAGDKAIKQSQTGIKHEKVTDEMSDLSNAFYLQAGKVLFDLTKEEGVKVYNYCQALLNAYYDVAENMGKHSIEVNGMYTIMVRFESQKNLPKEFEFFANYDNYDRFFELVEEQDIVDLEPVVDLAYKLENIL